MCLNLNWSFSDLATANVGILVESVSLVDFGYIRHLVYNIMRMFALSGSYFSVVSYGTSRFRLTNFVQFRSEADIKKMVLQIPKEASGQVNIFEAVNVTRMIVLGPIYCLLLNTDIDWHIIAIYDRSIQTYTYWKSEHSLCYCHVVRQQVIG